MSWRRYEKEICKQHNGRHIGGPGNPDYIRGSVRGEVKHRQAPVTKPELMSLKQKGVTEIHSLAGFTQPAIDHVEKHT